jgi:hypothetical protein
MSNIVVANEYTKVACYGWTPKPKRKQLARKELVKKNSKATWAKGSVGAEDHYAGDLLARMFEETDKDIERQRFPGQEDFKNAEKRMGKIMHSGEFIRKTLSLNPNLIFEESKFSKGNGAFYWMKGKRKVYTAANFKLGWIPEWTIMKTDTADLPTREGLTYGWRTALQRLIQQRAVSKREADKIFGPDVPGDLRGKNWAIATQQFN